MNKYKIIFFTLVALCVPTLTGCGMLGGLLGGLFLTGDGESAYQVVTNKSDNSLDALYGAFPLKVEAANSDNLNPNSD